jgi:hypothetical protein
MRAAFLVLAGLAVSTSALAHGRVSIGVGVGFGYPFWGPPWGYPVPYYYPVPVVPAQSVTYIEQRSAAPASDGGAWWYYCDAARGYYPHVRECPSGWQRIAPTPPK